MTFYNAGIVMTMIATQRIGLATVTNPYYRLELPNTASINGRGRANQWVTYSSAKAKKDIQEVRDMHKIFDSIKYLKIKSYKSI